MLAEKLISKIGRKRNMPNTTIDELNVFLGTKKSTTGNKSKKSGICLNLAIGMMSSQQKA